MNQNPTMLNASENLTFILTGKLPKREVDKHREIAKEISDFIQENFK